MISISQVQNGHSVIMDLMHCDSLTVSNQFDAEEVKIDFGNGRIVIMETRD